jgi:small GTP-binding protein
MAQNDPKVVFAGEANVGKTSIFTALTKHDLGVNPEPTVGGTCVPVKAMTSDLTPVKIRLLDTAGSEKYRAIVPLYFRGADVIIVVYDITNKNSFDGIEYWLNLARENAAKDCAVMIVGNKSDLARTREVPVQDECEMKERFGAIGLFETSAFTGMGIVELTTAVADATVNVKRGEASELIRAKSSPAGCC